MIKFYDQVPSVYPNASRDFQYLCWLIDIVLNSVKHNVDDIYNLPNSNTESRLVELLAMTLGFKVKRNYDQNQLRALVAALPRILRYKGTKAAVDMAGHALIAASGAAGSYSSSVKDGELEVMFPENLVDVSLFTDLLPYILPAGMTCRVLRTTKLTHAHTIDLRHYDIMLAEWLPDIAWDKRENKRNSIGLSGLFNVDILENEDNAMSGLSNYRDGEGALSDRFNAGLLDNTVIPTLIEDDMGGNI